MGHHTLMMGVQYEWILDLEISNSLGTSALRELLDEYNINPDELTN